MKTLEKNLYGPWAIVTGASAGIGQEFARQLAAGGLHLVLVARRRPLLETLGRELAQTYGIQYRVVAQDLSDPGFLSVISQATADLDIGLLVSNAGTGVPAEFLTLTTESLQQTVQVNVTAHMLLTHHFGQRFAQNGRGGIILVSAMGAGQGIPFMANPAATKSYLLSLGQALHVELQRQGVRLMVLLPGPTQTPVIEKFGFDPEQMPMKPMPVAQCVTEALAAFEANRATHLTGRLNRLVNGALPDAIIRKMNGALLEKAVRRRQNKAVDNPLRTGEAL